MKRAKFTMLSAVLLTAGIMASILAASKPAGLSGEPGSEELASIERSIRDCIGWAKAKDFDLLYGVIANDADFLEVHPDGAVVRGFEQFKKAETFWGSPDFKAIRYDIRDLKKKRRQCLSLIGRRIVQVKKAGLADLKRDDKLVERIAHAEKIDRFIAAFEEKKEMTACGCESKTVCTDSAS